MDRVLTEPQKKALRWMEPGVARKDATREVSAALKSLALYHNDLVRVREARTPRGRWFLAYDLTEAGVTLRHHVLAQTT